MKVLELVTVDGVPRVVVGGVDLEVDAAAAVLERLKRSVAESLDTGGRFMGWPGIADLVAANLEHELRAHRAPPGASVDLEMPHMLALWLAAHAADPLVFVSTLQAYVEHARALERGDVVPL